MNRSFLNVAIFTLVIVLAFVWIGQLLTDISGGGVSVAAAEGVNPEAGESIYWGKGKCSTCHSIGSRGSAIRGPDHEGVAATAVERAAELGLSSATEYLVQSIADPSAHLVEGFKDEMPFVYLPPIALAPDEIRAVITYLQSQGGEVDIAAINLPGVILQAAASGAGEEPFQAYLEGDPAAGQALFFDEASDVACGKCHTFGGQGGQVGPELTEATGTRTLAFIIQSILEPSAKIASGFEPILLRLGDGKTINGVLRAEDESSLTIVTKAGEEITILKSDIDRRAADPPSLMPDNFAEILSVTQLHDILAFLQGGAPE